MDIVLHYATFVNKIILLVPRQLTNGFSFTF